MNSTKSKIINNLVSLVCLPLKFAVPLFKRFDSEKAINQARKQVDSYGMRHEVPGRDYPEIGHKIKDHLLDTKGDWLVGPDGESLTTKIHENELFTGYVSPAIPLVYLVGIFIIAMNMIATAIYPPLALPIIAILIAYLYGLYKIEGFGAAFGFAMLTFPVFAISQVQKFLAMSIPAMSSQLGAMNSTIISGPFIFSFAISLLPALFIYFKTSKTVKDYYSTLANNGLIHRSSIKFNLNPERELQAINSAADDSELFDLGEALGITAKKGDVFGPDKGQRFKLSHLDLKVNLLSEGKTRTGKTACVLKPLAMFIRDAFYPGEGKDFIIVACGKNTLTKDFVAANIVKTRIHPNHMKLNWIHEFSVKPEFISNEIVKAVQGKNQKNDHWTLSGKIAFECGLTIHRALIEMGHGNKSQNSYFQTIKDIQLSMSEDVAEFDQQNPEFLKQIAGKSEEEIALIKKELTKKFANSQKSSIINKLIGHPDLVNEETMLYRAISNYEMIFAKTPEERSGVFSTLASWIDMFTSNVMLNKWSFIEESENGFTFKQLTEQGDNVSIELAEDELGLAGPILTKLFFKFMSSYMILNRQDNNPTDPYFHFFLDEAHLIADENLADIMSVCLAKRFSYKLAFQMDESILSRFSESYLATLKENCLIQMTFNSSAATLKSFSENNGYAYTLESVIDSSNIDLIGTIKLKAGYEWFNINSEKRDYLRKLFRRTHSKFSKGQIKTMEAISFNKKGANSDPLQSTSKKVQALYSKEPMPIFGKADFTNHFSEPFVMAVNAKVAGVPRRDFVRCQPMNNKGERINVSQNALQKLIDQKEKLNPNEKITKGE